VIARRFARDRSSTGDEDNRSDEPARTDERQDMRVLSWSPDPFDEPEVEPEAEVDESGAPPPRAEAPPRRVREPAATADPPQEKPSGRPRGRPRGRAVRRQIHFHVDPDEEQLLMAAVAQFGSQQKGLVAGLRSLQETEELRAEIERLTAECERQRFLLAEARALFKR
jgi:hypothetical protein